MEATMRAFNSARSINISSPLMDELTEDVKTLLQSNISKKKISDIINKKEKLHENDLRLLNNFVSRVMKQKVPPSYVNKTVRHLRKK